MQLSTILKAWFAGVLLLFGLYGCAGQQSVDGQTPAANGERYRILITNDDGIESEGIRQLALAIAEFAEVVVVAPEKNESGASQSSRIMRVRAQATPVEIAESFTAWAVNGTPSDCVAFGVRLFGREDPFDLVLSGINHGANGGTAYLYSGTIGAAFQGLADEIPAIAVSQATDRAEFTLSARFTADAVKSVLAEPMPEGVLLSINVPAGEIRGVKVLPADGTPYNVQVERAEDEQGVFYKPVILPLDEPYDDFDITAYRAGYITMSPLKLDRNAYGYIEKLEKRSFVDDWNVSSAEK
jgi:5'-nucleotidase